MRARSNAERAQFHRSLAAQQEAELAELLRAPCAAPAPQAADARDDWRGAALADALASFSRTHGALLGTRPFLRGWRAWLEAQRGLESPLVWRLRPEALTQSGGPAWARDAVALLRAHAVRRPQLELQGQQSELPEWCVALACETQSRAQLTPPLTSQAGVGAAGWVWRRRRAHCAGRAAARLCVGRRQRDGRACNRHIPRRNAALARRAEGRQGDAAVLLLRTGNAIHVSVIICRLRR